MFIGHFAVGLAAKKLVPKVNLAVLFGACQLSDLAWPLFALSGIERANVELGATEVTPFNFEHYPFSHGLAMNLVWALLLGLAVARLQKSRKAGFIVGPVVLSHWVLDFISHRPDMPIFFGDPKISLGLWHSKFATLIVEGSLFAGGLFVYLRATSRVTTRAKWLFWSLIGFLLVIYGFNLFGPLPPPDMPTAAIAGPALALWVFVIWAYYADRPAQTLE